MTVTLSSPVQIANKMYFMVQQLNYLMEKNILFLFK